VNWEKSKSLTPLKYDFLRGFFALDHHFFLSGGSALGIFYLEHRLSYDLDFFSTQEVDWHQTRNLVQHVANDIGADLEAITEAPFFYRFKLLRGAEKEVLDFVAEKVRQIDEEKENMGGIAVDTLREIAANKLCALLGRGEQKDVVDLYFLQQAGINLSGMIELAANKEGGMEPAILSWVLSQIHFDEIPPYVLKPLTADELNAFLADLTSQLADLSFPAQPE
jgi:hypothetical protein